MNQVISRDGDQQLQNLSRYVSGTTVAKEYLANHREVQEWNYLLRPLDVYIVNPIATQLTEKVAIPVLKAAYFVLGTSTVFTIGIVNHSCAQKIDDALYDPISTETLLKQGERVKVISKMWSVRTPVNFPMIEYVDTCSIAVAQHVCVFSTDMLTLLHAPPKLRRFADLVYIAADEEIIQPLVRDGVELGRSIVQKARTDLPTVESGSSSQQKQIKDADKVGELSPQNGENTSQGWGGYFSSLSTNVLYFAKVGAGFATAGGSQLGGFAARVALSGVRDHVNGVISQNEKIVRQKIGGQAVHSVASSVLAASIRGVVRGGVSVAGYVLLEHVIISVMPHQSEESLKSSQAFAQTLSMVIALAGTLVWLRCLTKTADRMHRTYQPNFKPDASTLQEIVAVVGQEKVYGMVDQVTQAVNVYVNKEDSSYLANFSRRVVGIPKSSVHFVNPYQSRDPDESLDNPIVEDPKDR